MSMKNEIKVPSSIDDCASKFDAFELGYMRAELDIALWIINAGIGGVITSSGLACLLQSTEHRRMVIGYD